MQCGGALATGCPVCGATNAPGDLFCGEWPRSSPLTAAAAMSTDTTTALSGPVAERRLVTVLFADLVGFTSFSEERDAEDVRETPDPLLRDGAADIVDRYGGAIEKFIGDAVMAVWGAPVAHEDDAERAVRAGLDLVDVVPRASGPAIQARAGVLTGEAAVTVGAASQGMVTGDLVNTAARLQSVAPPGGVLVGEATTPPQRRRRVRARRRPVAQGQVLARPGAGSPCASSASAAGSARSTPSSRRSSVATTSCASSRTCSTRRGASGGPPRVDHRPGRNRQEPPRLGVREVPRRRGRAGLVAPRPVPVYGEGVTFWALGEMIRRRAGLTEGDDAATTRERTTQTVASGSMRPEDRAWAEPALAIR